MNQIIFSLDKTVSLFFVNHANPVVGNIAKTITSLADFNFLVFVIFIVGIISFVRKNRNFIDIIAITSIGYVVADWLKVLFVRMRPPHILYKAGHFGFSFPSGHALLATVVYGLVGYWLFRFFKKRWQKNLALYGSILIILLVGISRLVLNVHWFSDVVVGWILGGSILLFVIKFNKQAKV